MRKLKIKLLERKIKRITSKIYKMRYKGKIGAYKYGAELRSHWMVQRTRMYAKLRSLKSGKDKSWNTR